MSPLSGNRSSRLVSSAKFVTCVASKGSGTKHPLRGRWSDVEVLVLASNVVHSQTKTNGTGICLMGHHWA